MKERGGKKEKEKERERKKREKRIYLFTYGWMSFSYISGLICWSFFVLFFFHYLLFFVIYLGKKFPFYYIYVHLLLFSSLFSFIKKETFFFFPLSINSFFQNQRIFS